MDTHISGSSGNSTRNRPQICSGEYRFCRYCSTVPRSARFVASFAGFGRAARSQAAACALVARYRPDGSALRPSSREIVDGEGPSRAGIYRIDSPAARASAISSLFFIDM